MRVRTCALLLALALTSPARALAQGFALDRLHPPPAGDPFFSVPGATVTGHLRPGAVLIADYARAPLVLRTASGHDEVGKIVSARLNFQAALSLAVAHRALFSLHVPVVLLDRGDSPVVGGASFPSPDGVAFSDVRAGVRLRLLGDEYAPLQLAVAGTVWLPSGRRAEYTGDGAVRAAGTLIAGGQVGRTALWSATAGFLGRRASELAGSAVGSELVLGAALGFLAAEDNLLVGPEVHASTAVAGGAKAFDERSTNAEALFGVRYRGRSLTAGLAAGPGLTVGMGTPDLRVVALAGHAPRTPRPEPPRDSDGDGIADPADACPMTPGVPHQDPRRHGCPPDRDDDGIIDAEDACPLVPGVRDPDPSKNGCPPDRDGDGVIDAEDACPAVPGVRDPDPKKNGCPPDRDGDGIIDAEDACPLAPGVRDPDPKKNGCPPDRDGDGIIDAEDACPRESGPRDPDPAKNGCPTLIRVTEREIVILRKIHFEYNKARIMPDSSELLSQIAQVLKERPEITRVSIEGHTDSKGSARFNLKLSQQRADAVKAWLVEHGIDPARLEAKGFGKTRPIADNKTEEGRERNRRVEFHILEGGMP